MRSSSPTFELSGAPAGSPRPGSSLDTSGSPVPHGLEDIWQHWQMPGISGQAAHYLNQAWALYTHKRYASAWRAWGGWCAGLQIYRGEAPQTEVLNFVSRMASTGRAYRSVNNFRSAISARHALVDGRPMDSHLLICKLLNGVRLSNPPFFQILVAMGCLCCVTLF